MGRILIILSVVTCIGLVVILCRPRQSPLVGTTGYKGHTFNQVVGELGQPVLIDHFKLGQPLNELRGTLLRTFPLDQPGNEKIEIREVFWKDGDYYITMWFQHKEGQWRVVDSVRWHKNVRF